MRRWRWRALATAGTVLALTATTAWSAPPVVVVDVGYGHPLGTASTLTVRPPQATPTGDGTLWWEHLRWQRWGLPTAYADGGLSVNDCRPYCAAGHVRHYPQSVAHARLYASQLALRHCRGRLVRAYTRYAFVAHSVQRGLKTTWHLHLDSRCTLQADG